MARVGSVAVIGTGKMGEIMAAGMARGGLDAAAIRVSDVNQELARAVSSRHGLTWCPDNGSAVERAQVVLLAVKPQVVPAVLQELSSILSSDQVVLSIAAGVTTASIEDCLARPCPVVRAMPNAASKVGQGVTAICSGSNAGEADLEAAEELLGGVGPVLRVAEGAMDAVTALSGSGPAYFALFAEALVEGGVTAGLPRATALQLVAQTMLGSAALLTEGQMTPAELREAVTSPAGTTAHGLRELERGGVRAAILAAVQAALDRSLALSQPTGRA